MNLEANFRVGLLEHPGARVALPAPLPGRAEPAVVLVLALVVLAGRAPVGVLVTVPEFSPRVSRSKREQVIWQTGKTVAVSVSIEPET